ncbi:PepSY domain-containing protein [Rheinheimera sp. D18]|uniref:PepSY domain-containing protein n=1 Tax=Rheinheimera sp. D18 TaxID=2545632 RepID=UPI00104E2D3E|nr:PepSY domain-containing protein [Rheinheimera sp. D18]QBL10469.1 PepSY domain-containing protein [Rheinheimera sp. D18]
MNTRLLMTTLLTASLLSSPSFADDDCNDPVAQWQPKKVLREKLEAEGWKVQRIKVDDGCYEVKGYDQNGNKVKAEYFPASLRLRKLEIKFDKDAVNTEELYGTEQKRNLTNNGDQP